VLRAGAALDPDLASPSSTSGPVTTPSIEQVKVKAKFGFPGKVNNL